MKKVFAILLTLLLAICGLAVAEDASLTTLTEKGTFVLGLDDSFPPMGFRDENNEIVGFDIDVAAAVCQKLGVELVLQPIDWSAKELELNGGNIDCIWNGMSITPDREESMSLTFPYLNNQIMAYVKVGSGIASVADLAGKKVAVQSGSTADGLLTAELADVAATFGEVLSFDEYLTAVMDLQSGGCDAVLMDVVVGDYKIASMENADIEAAFALSDDNYGIGFRKADVALRDAVQNILIDLKKDGTLAEISTKWFGNDITVVPAE